MKAAELLPALEASYRQWLRPGDSVLLAVSGGTDSMALMHGSALIQPRFGVRLEVACIDHGLRPGSAKEAEQVAASARSLGLHGEVACVAVSSDGNLEAAARDARYAALEAIRSSRGLSFIATAHTASDQVETVLMRLGRGSALRGVRGIQALRGTTILRPLLGVERAACARFLKSVASSPWRIP